MIHILKLRNWLTNIHDIRPENRKRFNNVNFKTLVMFFFAFVFTFMFREFVFCLFSERTVNDTALCLMT